MGVIQANTSELKQRLSKVRKSQHGFGLVLLMAFLTSTIVMALSLQLTSGVASSNMYRQSQQNTAAQQLAITGMEAVRDDILSQLTAGGTVDTSYRYPGASPAVQSVTAYKDPANHASGTDVIGSYYGTVLYARGNTYVINVVATVGNATYSQSNLFNISTTTTTESAPPSFDCTVVENAVAAGTLASVADADLIDYAQHDCMKKSGASTMPTTALNSVTGTQSCSALSGSTPDPLNLMNCTGTVTIAGSYTTLDLDKTTSIGSGTLTSTYNVLNGTRTLHVAGNVSGRLNIISTAGSGTTTQQVFYKDGITITGQYIDGNSSDAYSKMIVRMNGTFASSAVIGSSAGYLRFVPGVNEVYVNTLKAGVMANSGSLSSNTYVNNGIYGTSNKIYFDSISTSIMNNSTGTENAIVWVYGSNGDDIIGCNATFGTSPACSVSASVTASGGTNNATVNIYGEGGNDIISLNGTVTASALGTGTPHVYVYGQTGYDIIFVDSCNSSSNVTIHAGNEAGELYIIGSGSVANCGFSGNGASDVLLYKTGSTSASFGRKLTY